jgi:hypothetical protein
MIKRRLNPKLAKPRMGLDYAACIRRLIEWFRQGSFFPQVRNGFAIEASLNGIG